MRPSSVCAAFVLLLVGCSSRGSAGDAGLEARVDAVFAAHIRGAAPGCAVGVYRDGAMVLAKGYGVASLEDGRTISARTTFGLGRSARAQLHARHEA
jgi:CubicO group peptidase (beta-lactamase class C family)